MKSYKMSKACSHLLTAQVPFTSDQVPSAQSYYGVLLFVDISGFTALTEKYTAMQGQDHGVDELTNGLNCYISKIVDCILMEGGDILNYAGDAVLAQWAVEGLQPSDVISLCVKCALKIQSEYGVHEMKYDCELRVKIAISYGELSKIVVGRKSRCFYVVIGPAVDEVRLAEPLANPGDVILSPKTWQLCPQENFVIKCIENKKAVKMLRFKKEPSFSVEMYQEILSEDNKALDKSCLREAFQSMPDTETQNCPQKYTMKTALKNCDDNHRLELTSEIRPVTIMFIHINYSSVCTPMELCRFLQEITVIISRKLNPHGHINKISFFDKGCTFLCIYGLPGCKTKEESTLALKAAYSMYNSCFQRLKNLKTLSIGLTTGLVYCGIMGHHLRNEYTVMGVKVNLAARLMMHYPGIISCDWETRYYSKLPSCYFKEEIEKDLDGVTDPGKIYRFNPKHHRIHVDEATEELEVEKNSMVEAMHCTLTELNILGASELMTVKCAAFLGLSFITDMLQSILPLPLSQNLNKILITLFNSGIFKCASKMTKVRSAQIEQNLICYCEENTTDGLASIAGVWKCQFMRFCKRIVMEMTYKQLLKEQKRQLHNMCVSYLEKKVYRCTKCATNTENTLHKNDLNPTVRTGNVTENFLAKVDSIVKEEQALKTTVGKCECTQLLETVLIPLIKHCRGIGDVSRLFFYLLEGADVCASLSDTSSAMHYLTEAKAILENLENSTNKAEDFEHPTVSAFNQAIVYRLTGEILFNAGNIIEAEDNFKKSLMLLNCNIPSNCIAQSIKLVCEKIKKNHYQSKYLEMPQKRKLEYLGEQISCLSFLWQISCIRGLSKSASLAISMERNLATRSTDMFKILFSSTDDLKYSQFVSDETRHSLETWLCRMCAELPDCADSWRVIAHLTRTLAIVQLCNGNLKESIDFATRAQEMGRLGLDARAIGVLHLALLFTGRYKKSLRLIYKLERLGNEMSSIIAKGWFYAACLNILLYCGNSMRSFEECLAFVKEYQSDENLIADKSLMMHLYSSLALWFARLNDWENFATFYDMASKMFGQIPTSIHSVSGVTAFLECNVLLFKKEQEEFSRHYKKTYKKTQKLFSDFQQCFGGAHIFVPRVLHLNALLYQLAGRKNLVKKLLIDALQLCEKQGNLLDHEQIKQSQATWTSECISECPSDGPVDIWHKAAVLKPEELFQYCQCNADFFTEVYSDCPIESIHHNLYEDPFPDLTTEVVYQDQSDQTELQNVQDKGPAVVLVDMCSPISQWKNSYHLNQMMPDEKPQNNTKLNTQLHSHKQSTQC